MFCFLKKQTCHNETISRIDSASVHRCQLHPSGQSAASVEGDVTYNAVEGEKENNGRVTVCTDEYCVVVTVLLCFRDSCISSHSAPTGDSFPKVQQYADDFMLYTLVQSFKKKKDTLFFFLTELIQGELRILLVPAPE